MNIIKHCEKEGIFGSQEMAKHVVIVVVSRMRVFGSFFVVMTMTVSCRLWGTRNARYEAQRTHLEYITYLYDCGLYRWSFRG